MNNICIQYNDYSSDKYKYKNDLKLCLIYLFPEKEKEINIYISKLNSYEHIYITDNELTFDVLKYKQIYFCLTCIDFINLINFSKKLDNNTYGIETKIISKYNFIIDYFKNYDIDYTCLQKELIFIKNKNEIFIINEQIYKEFFNNVKLIDVNTFIRNLKLNKIL